MNRIAILAARRTPIGTFGGQFREVSATELGITALSAALTDAAVDPNDVDEVIVGNVLSADLGQNVARQIAIGAGLPVQVPAFAVNKLCGSSLKAVALAAGAIRLGEAKIIAAGGAENMSRCPYAVSSLRYGARMGEVPIIDLLLRDGLNDAFEGYHMGVTAENLAAEWKVTRREMDELAAVSQARAQEAMRTGRFEREIVPVAVPQRKGEPLCVATDEHPRAGVTAESLAALRPAFAKEGSVTAGNSSGINDGAAFVVLASEEEAERLGREPLAYVRAYASAGVPPSLMGFGPVPATQLALERAGWELGSVELVELNEAFAAQSIAVLRGLAQSAAPLDPQIVNVNGGAIALGHPIGASGCRILVTLVQEMARRGSSRGLATMCIGGGQGIAMLVERR